MLSRGEMLRSAVFVVTGCIITVVCLKMWQMKLRSRHRENRGNGDEERRQGDQGVQVDAADRQGDEMEPRKVPQEHDCQILLRSKCNFFLCLSSGKKFQFYMTSLIMFIISKHGVEKTIADSDFSEFSVTDACAFRFPVFEVYRLRF